MTNQKLFEEAFIQQNRLKTRIYVARQNQSRIREAEENQQEIVLKALTQQEKQETLIDEIYEQIGIAKSKGLNVDTQIDEVKRYEEKFPTMFKAERTSKILEQMIQLKTQQELAAAAAAMTTAVTAPPTAGPSPAGFSASV